MVTFIPYEPSCGDTDYTKKYWSWLDEESPEDEEEEEEDEEEDQAPDGFSSWNEYHAWRNSSMM